MYFVVPPPIVTNAAAAAAAPFPAGLVAPLGHGHDVAASSKTDPSKSDTLSLVGADESLCASHDAATSLDRMTNAVAVEEAHRVERILATDAAIVAGSTELPAAALSAAGAALAAAVAAADEDGTEPLIEFSLRPASASFDPASSRECPLPSSCYTTGTSGSSYNTFQNGVSTSTFGSSANLPGGGAPPASSSNGAAVAISLPTPAIVLNGADPNCEVAAAAILGRGASATVRLEERAGRLVAVKTIMTCVNQECHDAAVCEEAFARRAAEANQWQCKSSTTEDARLWRNVVRVHSVASDAFAGETTVIMEPVIGRTLRDVAASLFTSSSSSSSSSPLFDFPTAVLKEIARQLLSGLHCLHADLRVLHNDVKLENILVAESEGPTTTVKIIDFGCAVVLPREGGDVTASSCTSQRGSLTTMAPERLRGRSYGAKADVWSAGVVLLQLARGGAHPFLPDVSSPLLASSSGSSSVPGASSSSSSGKSAMGSTKTFWSLAAALKFTEGTDACATAVKEATAAAIDASPLASDLTFRSFIDRALTVDMSDRPTCADLLTHAWLV